MLPRKIIDWSWDSEKSQQSFIDCVGFNSAEESEKQVAKIEQFLNLSPCRMIDIGCGTGRQSIVFAAKGYTVTGIDIAGSFLEIAERTAKKQNLSVDFSLCRASKLQKKNAYDFALAYNHSIGFISDKELPEHFRKIHECLRPGGVFFYKTAGPMLTKAAAVPVKSWAETKKEFVLVDKKTENNFRHEICITINKENGEITEYRERQRAFSFAEILSLLKNAGFQKIESYADLDKSIADKDNFGIFVCHKK